MLERRIEEAGLNSWPAYQQKLFDGWVMRFSHGYTKRANSVTPLYPSFLPLEDKVSVCQKIYQEQHQPMIFRLPSFSEDAQELDALLKRQAYQYVDRTHVLSTTLLPDAKTLEPVLQMLPLIEWLPLFYQFSQNSIERYQIHRSLLERIAPEPLFAVLFQNGQPVACGVGVLEHDLFGLFDIVTTPQQRRQGYGTQLITTMLAWAKQHGATRAYLQVVGNNDIARHMYEKLGFREVYHYWYRVENSSR
jgi:N-acetylglutamate synthase